MLSSTKVATELPPLPVQITDTMSQLASNSGSKPLPSIFSFLHPMNGENSEKESAEDLGSILNLGNPVSKSVSSSNSLPFTEEVSRSTGSQSSYDFEDPFDSQIEKMEREDKQRHGFTIPATAASSSSSSSPVDLAQLRANAKSRMSSLLGDVLNASSSTKPLFDESLARNPSVVEKASVIASTGSSSGSGVLSSSSNSQSSSSSSQSSSSPSSTTTPSQKKKKKRSTKVITIDEETSVLRVSQLLGLPVKDCLAKLHELEDSVTDKSDLVSCDAVELLAMDVDVEVRVRNQFDLHPHVMEESPTDLPPRPPVVAVMGHVDHGKTTLLDFLRRSSVAASEAGGITQRISSFNVTLDAGQRITFIDTPGHAAFAAMRARGASATDIVLLVVAADDGVKAQTEEVLRLVQKTKSPLVVAVTKCGKKTIDPEAAVRRVGTQLLDFDVVTTPFGGETPIVAIDSLTGMGIPALKTAIYEEGVLREVRANRGDPGEAVVLETRVRPGAGIVLDSVVRWGSFAVGSVCVVGTNSGKIKQIWRDGKPVKTSTAGDTVEIGGINGATSGDWLLQVKDEATASAVIAYRKRRLARQRELAAKKAGKPLPKEEGKTVIPLVLKADVEGSLEVKMSGRFEVGVTPGDWRDKRGTGARGVTSGWREYWCGDADGRGIGT